MTDDDKEEKENVRTFLFISVSPYMDLNMLEKEIEYRQAFVRGINRN